jgi:hypothetical protein
LFIAIDKRRQHLAESSASDVNVANMSEFELLERTDSVEEAELQARQLQTLVQVAVIE